MKLRHLFLALLASAASFVGCDLLGDLEDLGEANVSLDLTEIVLPKEGGSKTIQLVATRDWEVKVALPDWLALSANSGKASLEPQSITITVDENKGNDREATITFNANFVKASVLVKQEGAMGEIKKGSGTKEDPYTVAGVVEYLETLGADVNSPIKVYVKGKVASIKEEFSAQYGNANFDITDNGEVGDVKFTCYRVLYLGNKKWAEGDTQIKLKDDVVIFGNVVNFKGNTPETQQGNAFLFSLNGVDKGGDEGGQGSGSSAEAKGTGTATDPFNVAAAIAKAQATGQTATADAYYIKGKVKSVTEQFGAQYGNGTFDLVDEGFDAVFTAYRILYFGNKKWAEGDKTVNENDEIVVVGKIVNYKGNTPETDQGSAYLYSLNGETGDPVTPPEDETFATPAGDGSQANPFNVSAAIAKAKEVGETATEKDFYVKGKVSKITEQFGAQYGNGTFVLVDEGYTAVFTAYRILYFGGEKWQEGDATVAVNDEIVAVGKIVNFKGNTPEITQGGHLYSLNGQTSMAQSPVFEVEKTEIKVSASATSAEIKVKGNVAWTVSRKPDQVTCNPTSGEGAGTVTVTFAANESTENEVGYTIALSTEADVTNKTILVNIIQAKASVPGQGGTITIPLNNATTFAEDNGGDALKNGFAATVEGFKVATYQYKSTTKPVTPDQYSMRVYKSAVFYIEAPSGTTITALVFKANNYDNGKYILDLTGVEGTSGTATADKAAEIIKWEGSASTVILQAAAGQTRLENVEVYYE